MSFFRNSVSLFNIAHKKRNQMGLNLTGYHNRLCQEETCHFLICQIHYKMM